MDRILAGARVLAVGTSSSTALLCEYLAECGADVQHFPIPVARRRPFAAAESTMPTEPVPGIDDSFHELAANVELIVTHDTPETLEKLAIRNSLETFTAHGVWLSITPWGLTGPWSEKPGNDLAIYAESGLMETIGEPQRGPLRLPGSIASAITANAALPVALAALYALRQDGIGQLADISMLEVMASNHEIATVLYAHTGRQRPRNGNRLTAGAPWTLLPCKDGFVGVIIPEGRWADFVSVAGIPELDDERFATRGDRVLNVDELEGHLTAWMRDKTAAELYEWAQALMLPWAPVQPLSKCFEDQHLLQRHFLQRSPAGGLAFGFPASVTTVESLAHGSWRSKIVPPSPGITRTAARGPLEGVRVIDFGIAWAGALVGRLLGDMGADVIKIETRRRLDTRGALTANPVGVYVGNDPGPEPWNRSGTFVDRHRNKHSIAIELDTEGGREVLYTLVRTADILIENFAPRVLSNLGADFAMLKDVNPDLIYLSLSGFGHTGPRRDQVAFGDTIEQLCGASDVTGYSGGPPMNSGTHWPDTASGYLGAGLAIAGLLRSHRHAQAIHIDLSELEVALRCLPDLLQYTESQGKSPGRTGNRGWETPFEDAFETADGRTVVASFPADTAGFDIENATQTIGVTSAVSALASLEAGGVTCGLVRRMDELFTHPQLVARSFWITADFDGTQYTTIGFPAKLSRTPMSLRAPAPKFGEHYGQILSEIPEIDSMRIDDWVRCGAVSTRPGIR